MQIKQSINAKSGYTVDIFIQEFTNAPVATVIESHGGITNNAEHSVKASEKLINLLGEKNINFVTIQFSNNGTYENQDPANNIFSSRVNELESVIDYINSKYFGDIVLLGSSLGGHIVANATYPENLKCIILNCPALNAAESIRNHISKEDFDKWQEFGYVSWNNIDPKYPNLKLPWHFYEDLLNNIGFEKLKLTEIPTLIFHGDNDKITDIKISRNIVNINKNIRLIEIPGGGHRFNMGENEWELTAEDFILQNLKSTKQNHEFT